MNSQMKRFALGGLEGRGNYLRDLEEQKGEEGGDFKVIIWE